MKNKKGVVFQNEDFRVEVVGGGRNSANLKVTRAGVSGKTPTNDVVVKIIAESGGLAIVADEGQMIVASDRPYPNVLIKPKA